VSRTLRSLVVGLLCAGLLAVPVSSGVARPPDKGGQHGAKVPAKCRLVLRQVELASGRVTQAQALVTADAAKVAKRKAAYKKATGKAKAHAKSRLTKAKKSLKGAKAHLRKESADLQQASRNAANRGCGG
jgi:hypothetical protein